MGYSIMSRFIERYLDYRRVGHGRLAAFHFAWIISSVAARSASIR